MFPRFIIATAIALLVSGCARARVVDLKILPCPRDRITRPICIVPPPSGTKRDQGDVFANELGCWRRVTAWEAAHADCGGKMP